MRVSEWLLNDSPGGLCLWLGVLFLTIFITVAEEALLFGSFLLYYCCRLGSEVVVVHLTIQGDAARVLLLHRLAHHLGRWLTCTRGQESRLRDQSGKLFDRLARFGFRCLLRLGRLLRRHGSAHVLRSSAAARDGVASCSSRLLRYVWLLAEASVAVIGVIVVIHESDTAFFGGRRLLSLGCRRMRDHRLLWHLATGRIFLFEHTLRGSIRFLLTEASIRV
mmetsp:Transcript_33789/g.41787  ORF Transcript_33789/g.41787 Transcript_33789/m.41787 type:complete len:221 (-) Transcript_33789:2226-2888(-)